MSCSELNLDGCPSVRWTGRTGYPHQWTLTLWRKGERNTFSVTISSIHPSQIVRIEHKQPTLNVSAGNWFIYLHWFVNRGKQKERREVNLIWASRTITLNVEVCLLFMTIDYDYLHFYDVFISWLLPFLTQHCFVVSLLGTPSACGDYSVCKWQKMKWKSLQCQKYIYIILFYLFLSQGKFCFFWISLQKFFSSLSIVSHTTHTFLIRYISFKNHILVHLSVESLKERTIKEINTHLLQMWCDAWRQGH